MREPLLEAIALLRARKPDDAIRACQFSLQSNPRDSAALHAWGLVELDLRRHTEAVEHLMSASQLDPCNAPGATVAPLSPKGRGEEPAATHGVCLLLFEPLSPNSR